LRTALSISVSPSDQIAPGDLVTGSDDGIERRLDPAEILFGTVTDALPACEQNAELLNRINLIPAVQSDFQKYFPSGSPQIKSISLASYPTKGRIAIVTDAGWDAVDAAASGA
jgi:hypothetical protein